MKVWISKYALSDGVSEVDVDAKVTESGGLTFRSDTGYQVYYSANDWHNSKEKAVTKAEEMRQRKLKSLYKQIKKLSEIKFE